MALTAETLTRLEYQARHLGHSSDLVESLQKRGVAATPHGAMIAVSPHDMLELILNYRPAASGHPEDDQP